MSKTTTEQIQYGLQRPDGHIDWVQSTDGDDFVRIRTDTGIEFNVTDSVGTEIGYMIRNLTGTLSGEARKQEERLHLPADTITPAVLVKRSITILFDEPTIVTA